MKRHHLRKSPLLKSKEQMLPEFVLSYKPEYLDITAPRTGISLTRTYETPYTRRHHRNFIENQHTHAPPYITAPPGELTSCQWPYSHKHDNIYIWQVVNPARSSLTTKTYYKRDGDIDIYEDTGSCRRQKLVPLQN